MVDNEDEDDEQGKMLSIATLIFEKEIERRFKIMSEREKRKRQKKREVKMMY